MTDRPSEAEALAALQRLGLSKYEAEVFVALRRLGRGTARDVADVTDVPRSQVYGAAESLEERGLVDVQRTKPKQFRPIPLSEAEETLRRRQERERDRAFEFLESIEPEPPAAERQEDIWTVNGRDTITDRIASLAENATASILYGASEETHDDAIRDVLVEAGDDGVPTAVMSTDRPVLDPFEETPVQTIWIPDELDPDEWPAARVIVVDDESVLLSVRSAESPDSIEETAFWSQETKFAGVLVQLIDGWFGDSILR